MNLELEVQPGRYVIAVSGGIDSMVLLHLLSARSGIELTIAHFDHGIREDSFLDRQFVEAAAQRYRLPFVYGEGALGRTAGEAAARAARYDFLHSVRRTRNARAVITAHHKDDVLETAVINLIRGTGRKGLASLRSTATILRPLLEMDRAAIEQYARVHDVEWRDDPSNQSDVYLRNHIRLRLLPRFSPADRERLYAYIRHAARINQELDGLLEDYLAANGTDEGLDRPAFILLPHEVSREVMAAWLRREGIRDFDRKTIERLVRAAKISAAGKRFDIKRGAWLLVKKNQLALEHSER